MRFRERLVRYLDSCADPYSRLMKFATVEEVQRLYWSMAIRLHPDKGGDKETMEQVNKWYERSLREKRKEIENGKG